MSTLTNMKINVRTLLLAAAAVAVFAGSSRALQPAAEDSLLFTIELTEDDSLSLFYRVWSDDIRNSLAGPVMMAGNRFLFHSKNGYALYDIKGKLVEEHSVIRENAAAAAAGRPQMYLAYPFDDQTVIYYTDADSVEVFRKRIGRRNLERVPPAEMEMFRDIKRTEPLNIYRSGTTEDVGRKASLRPHLAGFTALDGGSKWWSTSLFFSFTSPIIMETDGQFTSFFPGLKESEGGRNCDIPVKLIEPLGVFSREGRWYYLGLQSVIGSKDDEYFQTIVLCDQAGNILYCSRMMKQEITDAVLDRRRDLEGLTEFTVRRAGRHTFVPAVDAFGDIFYGIINWEWKKIEVYKRSFVRFLPSPTAPTLGDRFDREGRLSYYPITIDCSEASRRGIVPEVMYKDDKGEMRLLEREDLTKDNYYVMVHRLPDEDLRRKISRVGHTMPREIGAMQDSISKLQTTWCPYGISLNHEVLGTLSNLDYGFGDVVVNSWVLGISESKNVYVRVDLESWAEVVVFSQEGQFIERFTFNNTHYKDRKDVVVLSPERDEVFERDYEAGAGVKMKKGAAAGYRFVVWRKDILPIVSNAAAKPASSSKKKKK